MKKSLPPFDRIPVIFTSDNEFRGYKEENIIILAPVGRHDDFGFKSQFTYQYLKNKKSVFSGTLKLGFLNFPGSPHDIVKSKVKRASLNERGLPQYFTLQSEIQDYRSIVKNFGLEDARNFLLSINDIVAVKKYTPDVDWLEKAISSKPFKNSLSRTSDAFFAFLNAGSVLDGIEHETIGRISNEFDIRFSSKSFQNEFLIPIKFNFSSLLPGRIVTLIGKNGVGKSQTLRNLVEALQSGDSRVGGLFNEMPIFNRVIAIGTAGETEKTFPRPKKKSKINYKLIYSRASKKSDEFDGLSGLIIQLFRSQESIGKHSRLNLFLTAIKKIIPLENLSLPIFIDDEDEYSDLNNSKLLPRSRRPLPLAQLDQINESGLLDLTGRVDVGLDPSFSKDDESFPLSSGQITFLRLAAQLCLHIENGSLVLLDEPETHLHPNFITDLIELISTLLELTGSACILATHSAYIVREIPKNQVLIFTRSETGAIEISKPRLRTLGSDIGEISFSIFGDQNFGHLIESLKSKVQKLNNLSMKQREELLNELPSEALMYLENELDIKFD